MSGEDRSARPMMERERTVPHHHRKDGNGDETFRVLTARYERRLHGSSRTPLQDFEIGGF